MNKQQEKQSMLFVLNQQLITTKVNLASHIIHNFRKHLFWYPSTNVYVVSIQRWQFVEEFNCKTLEEAVDKWFDLHQ